MPVAARRKAQQRRRAEECAELVDRAPFRNPVRDGGRSVWAVRRFMMVPLARIPEETAGCDAAMGINSNTPAS